MRILQVSAHYPPDFVSGGTLVPQRFAKAALERGHESAVFAGRLEGLEPLAAMDTVEEGVPVRWIGNSSFLAWDDERNYRNPEVTQAFREFVEEWKPDIVHVHSVHTLGAELLPAAKEAGAAVVLTMHDFWWSCARQFLATSELEPCPVVVGCGECACSKDHAWLEKRNAWLAAQLASADLILAPSATAAEVFAANGAPAGKLRVNENGVDPIAQDDAGGAGSRSAGPVRFMYAGGEAELKGCGVLREACLAANVPTGTTLDVYNASATGFPGWARSCPAYGREELAEVFAAHDVLILPSIMRESHSIVTREALSAGLAVIATDTLGPEEAVRDGFNGRIVPAGDAAALAAAIEELAAPERCAELTGRGSASPIVTKASQEDELFGYYEEALRLADSAHSADGTDKESSEASRARMCPPDAPAGEQDVREVLIVTGIQGAPCRYRAHLAVEALATQGVPAQVRQYRDPALPELAARASAVVLYRVPATNQILELVEQVRATDTPILGDVDDLIFDPEIEPLLDNLDGLSKPERDLWRRGIYRYRTTLEHCDLFLGSTPTISGEAERLIGIPARTWANGVGAKLAKATERALAEPRAEGPLRIGYFSGTDTHDADWASIEPAVAQVLASRPEVELWLGGKVQPTQALAAYEERIRRLPFVVWHELPRHLKNLDVCLAPLTPGSIFNEAKSAIKWLEAALALTPTVASPTQPFRQAIEHGATGMLASTQEEWVEAIGALLDDAEFRAAMARRAKRRVLMELSPARQGERYLAILREARALVAAEGHHELSQWENVVDDEPLEAAASLMEPYELPRGGFDWRATRAGLAARKLAASLRGDGVAATTAKVVRKIGRIARIRA